jgi:hypothetical protein
MGFQTTDFSNFTDVILDIALQPDGKIVAVGYTDIDFALARYLPNGELDLDFGTNGKTITNAGADDVAYAVAIRRMENCSGRNVRIGICSEFFDYAV